jgi:hypothetical protein
MQHAAIGRVTDNPTLDLDLIFPYYRRRLPADLTGPCPINEPYQGLGDLLAGLGVDRIVNEIPS